MGKTYTGGCLGRSSGNITHTNSFCENLTISGSSYVGGFAGNSRSNLQYCHVASVTIETRGDYGGGLVAYLDGNLSSCYSERVDLKTNSSNMGGLVGFLTSSKVIDSCYVTNSKVKNNTTEHNKQYFGGLVGKCAGSITLSYVDQTEIFGSRYVGGLVGYSNLGSITKSFVKNTNIKGYDCITGGFAGTIVDPVQIDSCYLKDSNTILTIQADSDIHSISSFIASNSGQITNCYAHNFTLTGKDDYGALIGNNEASTTATISDCFITDNYTILVEYNKNATPLNNCYNDVTDQATFMSQIWSDGKTIEGGSTAWSNFNTSVFPPKLSNLTEP